MVSGQFFVSSLVISPAHPDSASRSSAQDISRSDHAISGHPQSHRTIVAISNSTRRPPGNMRMAARRERDSVTLRYQYGYPLQEASQVNLRRIAVPISASVVRPNPAVRFLMPETRPEVATMPSREIPIRQYPADQFRRIFGPSFDINLETSRDSAMCQAVRTGNTRAIELLLDVGTSLERRDKLGRTSLMLAVLSRSRPAIDVLLKSGADRNALDQSGNTLMMYAARQNNPYLIYKLRRAGCATDARNKFGNTALIVAIGQNHFRAVLSLLSSNTEGSVVASPDAWNSRGIGPLFVAMATRVRIGLSSYLRSEGVRDSRRREAMKNNRAIIRALLNAGADVNATDSMGNTLQIYAAILNDVRLLTMLRDFGADPVLKNKSGKSAMTYALNSGFPRLSAILQTRRTSRY